jgi:DNA repair protein RecN (Recombination protein N)
MLKLLHVRNFALMEDLTVTFDKGLTVITGETGAGKSIIVEAIAALCGERMDDISIRSNKDFAEITGVFETTPMIIARLQESGMHIDGDLIIRRKVERGKRQSSYINDQIVSIGLLRDLTREMVDLIGQYENQSLFNPKNHLSLLDSYAGLHDRKRRYATSFHEYRNLESRLESLMETAKQTDEKIDYLKFQINEIEKAHVQPHEEEQLNSEKDLLLSSEKRSTFAGNLVAILYDREGSVVENLYTIQKNLEELATLDPQMGELKERMESVISTAEDMYREVSSYYNKIEFSQDRLDSVLERLDVINKIKKKYGKTLEEVADYLTAVKKELASIESRDEELQKLAAAIKDIEGKVTQQAADLSLQRKKARLSLKKKIIKLLSRLGMEKAAFDIRIDTKELEEDGVDFVEFYISTNPGEDLKPLRKIASGGEISRITLCLKTILSDVDNMLTLIFDEVDTGIGGRIAEAVGELLATVSRDHQVICITHLPQITVFADNHILVKKEIRDKETFTHIITLDEDMRKMEIARMLGGKDITKKTVEHAAEFLQKVKQR